MYVPVRVSVVTDINWRIRRVLVTLAVEPIVVLPQQFV